MTESDTQFMAEPQAPRTLQGAATELPMIVWLRGDEPHCADFILEADDVMSQLGIRRSRLTQISGKELRVGRMRRGRYVSPVYRQSDVDAYLAWTRATASHMKSSSVLQEAAEALRYEGEALVERLAAAPDELASRVETSVKQGVLASARHVYAAAATVKGDVAALERLMHALAAGNRERLTALDEHAAATAARLGGAEARLSVVTKDLAEAAATGRLAREDIAALGSTLLAELAAQRDFLSELARRQHSILQTAAASAASHQAAIAALIVRIEGLAAAPSASSEGQPPPARAHVISEARRCRRRGLTPG